VRQEPHLSLASLASGLALLRRRGAAAE
jgi:hypothetical protein